MNDTFVPTTEDVLPDLRLAWDGADAERQIRELEAVSVAASTTSSIESKRADLKRELARAAITGFHPDAAPSSSSSTMTTQSTSTSNQNQLVDDEPLRTAEVIMKELEQMNPLPILRPASHHSLNAHWSFVFTGVPTAGMRLITLLSRISGMFPFELLDFRDVALCVTDEQQKAKAVVEVTVCGAWELVLEVCTSLRRPTSEDLENEYADFRGEEGTLLLEHFQGVELNGVEIPTPQSWHTTRTLEITYMDKDILIARTSGGEPHLLLRNSPLCYASPAERMLHADDDAAALMEEAIEECDLDGNGNKWTEFFSEAIDIYGERITRCLVDRDFGREEYEKKNEEMKAEDGRRGGGSGQWWKTLASGPDLGRQWGVGDDDKEE